MQYYIYAEDLASGLIGPFESENAAHNHVTFCRMRGDADPGAVITATEAWNLRREGRVDMEMTPEQDVCTVLAGGVR